MQKIECQLTVFFENPFWVGIYERREGSSLTVGRIVFGAEPKDYDVHRFLLQNWHSLRFSPPIVMTKSYTKRKNPKRMQRDIKKQLEYGGIGTRAQQARKLQQKEGKKAHGKQSRLHREQEKQKRFTQKQEKKKQKRKGH